MKAQVGCILCKSELGGFDDTTNHPMRATEFITYGHYGSAITDHMNGTKTAVNICDACLRTNAADVLIYEPNSRKPVRFDAQGTPAE